MSDCTCTRDYTKVDGQIGKFCSGCGKIAPEEVRQPIMHSKSSGKAEFQARRRDLMDKVSTLYRNFAGGPLFDDVEAMFQELEELEFGLPLEIQRI